MRLLTRIQITQIQKTPNSTHPLSPPTHPQKRCEIGSTRGINHKVGGVNVGKKAFPSAKRRRREWILTQWKEPKNNWGRKGDLIVGNENLPFFSKIRLVGSVGGDLLLVSSSSGWGFKWVPITSPIFLWVQVGMLER